MLNEGWHAPPDGTWPKILELAQGSRVKSPCLDTGNPKCCQTLTHLNCSSLREGHCQDIRRFVDTACNAIGNAIGNRSRLTRPSPRKHRHWTRDELRDTALIGI